MKLARTVVLLAGLIAGLSAWAQSSVDILEDRVMIATITSNYDSRVNELWLALDDAGNATRLERLEVATRKIKTFQIPDLAKGVVLMEESGRDIFILRSTEFDSSKGGRLELNFLHNGLTGSRRSVGLQAEVGADGWQLLHSGAAFTRMHVIANKILGKVVGVKELRFSKKVRAL